MRRIFEIAYIINFHIIGLLIQFRLINIVISVMFTWIVKMMHDARGDEEKNICQSSCIRCTSRSVTMTRKIVIRFSIKLEITWRKRTLARGVFAKRRVSITFFLHAVCPAPRDLLLALSKDHAGTRGETKSRYPIGDFRERNGCWQQILKAWACRTCQRGIKSP